MVEISESHRQLMDSCARSLWRYVYSVRRMMNSSDVIRRMLADKYLNELSTWEVWKTEAEIAGLRLSDVIIASKVLLG